MEIWKDIKGYEKLYQVSNEGRVKSLNRLVFNKGNGAHCRVKGVVLKPNADIGGYLYVGLHDKKNVKTQYIKVHRLVAFAFCEGHKTGLEVNHKNGIRDSNHCDNLEWVTRSQNIRDTYKRGRNTNGEKGNASKLFDRDVGVITSLYDYGISQTIIANSFGVTQATISNIVTNRTFKNGLIESNQAIKK